MIAMIHPQSIPVVNSSTQTAPLPQPSSQPSSQTTPVPQKPTTPQPQTFPPSLKASQPDGFNFPPRFPAAAYGIVQAHHPALSDFYSQQLYGQLLFTQRDHLLVALKDRLDLDPIVQVCAAYHKNNGLGADVKHPVSFLCRGLIIRSVYDLSFRQVEEQVRRDWLYRWFVGYPLFGETFDHSTLADFEKWVREQHVDLFFVEILRQIYEDFPEEMEAPQMGDTFAMEANAAKESLIRLIRHTSHLFLSVFADVNLDIYSQVMATIDAQALFGKEKERPEFYLSKAERKERQLKVAREALKLYDLARPRLIELDRSSEVAQMSAGLNQLNKILNDEFKIKRDKQDQVISFTKRDKHVKGSYRIGSATDPDATYRKHGQKCDFGFNVQIAATTNFVTGIFVETGAIPDALTIPNVLMFQHQHFGFWPYKLIYDRAAGTGKVVFNVADVTQGHTQVVAHMVDYNNKKKPRLGPADFTLSQDGQTMTCPNGQTTDHKYRHAGREGWSYHFTKHMCQGCPFLKECRGHGGIPTTRRAVYYSDYRTPYLRAVNYNQTEQFKVDMKLRPQIERIIAGLVLHNGARRARSRGIAKAGFQAKMSGMAYNIKRWMKLLAQKDTPAKATPKRGKYDLPEVVNA